MAALIPDLAHALVSTAELALEAISMRPDAFARAAQSRDAQVCALFIAFLAGVSEMLGQCVILIVNRTPLYRFIASLALTGAAYVLTALTWGLSVLAIAPLTPVGALGLHDFLPVTGVLALAFAPRLFGFLSIAPYFGQALSVFLEALAMGLAVFGLHAGLNLPASAALICGGAGWFVAFLFRAFFGHAFARPLRGLRRIISGTALERSPKQIIDDIITKLAEESRQ